MLSLIPTPIGNREDITLRALRLMRELEVFFCEDTRVAHKLFGLYEIPLVGKKLYAFRSFSSGAQEQFFLELLKANNCGVLSDAGTPGLSDPGKAFIKLCRENEITFEILPGATALIPAVVASPIDTTHFTYHGFLPLKKGRQTLLTKILQSEHPVYIYESVHRIEKLLGEIEKIGFTGTLLIARELSKMHEQYLHGSVEEIKAAIVSGKMALKGEFVIGFIPDSSGS